MARHQRDFANWSQYVAMRAISGFMHCFEPTPNMATAAGLGALFYRLSPRHRKRAISNISLSFPEWSPQRVARVAQQSIENMFQLFMVDAMVMPRRLTPTSWPRYIEVGDLRAALDRFVRDEATIFVTGHCGNWELLGYSLAVMGYPMYALARPLNNPFINDWLLGLREAQGLRIITKWGAIPLLQEVLRNGGRAAFIADQNAGEGGMFVPFFGRLASSYKSIGLLAMRYEVPIVAGFARRVGCNFRYELSSVDIIRPEDWTDQPDPLFYITARYNHAMETMIRRAPEQYLWVHRRWKSRPRHERLGQPVPAQLVAKLETLPWLTPADVEVIVQNSEPS